MIKICFLLVLIITVGTSSVISTNFHAYAVEAIWRDYENMKDLVNDIKNGDKDDDNMDWDKFRDSTVYKDEDEDVRDCIDLANKVGEKLGDYEVVRCFENASYFKEKYSGNAGSQNQSQGNVSQQQQVENQSQGQEEVISSESSTNSSDSCDSSYPDVCITTYSAILTCFDIPYRNFKVLAPDRHGFDSDGDGIGCEG
jgi:hypothetical protein